MYYPALAPQESANCTDVPQSRTCSDPFLNPRVRSHVRIADATLVSCVLDGDGSALGGHRYSSVVDGENWAPDPTAPRALGAHFGTPSSIVTVAERRS